MTTLSDVPLIQTLLTCSDCYDHPVFQLRLVETHISWVLLTGEYAYKIKKPVNLGFLDFSTLALRQQDCEDEVRLNRRLAPDFYLGVVAIGGSPNQPHMNTTSDPIEYAVKMRQFPPEATLDHLAEQDKLGPVHIDRVAARLAHFHLSECTKASTDSPWGDPDSIALPVVENFRLLTELLGNTQPLQMLKAWSLAEHARLTLLLHERKHNGFIRECHGDLHLGNMAWVEDKLVIFDCLEFNPALRWIDIISEVAFCYMDLLHRQQDELASRFLNAWLENTGDYQGVALLRYYAVYRAMVRAKVAALRDVQIPTDLDDEKVANHTELESCLQLAERLTQPEVPRLWITHGLSGSGKTTLTQPLLQQQAMIRLRSDVERKRMAGLAAMERSDASVGAGLYSPQSSERTYQHLVHLADHLLKAGWRVIIDATCLKRWQRELFRELAQRHQVDFRILDVQTNLTTLQERITQRAKQGSDASEADLRVLQHQIDLAEPFDSSERADVVVLLG